MIATPPIRCEFSFSPAEKKLFPLRKLRPLADGSFSIFHCPADCVIYILAADMTPIGLPVLRQFPAISNFAYRLPLIRVKRQFTKPNGYPTPSCGLSSHFLYRYIVIDGAYLITRRQYSRHSKSLNPRAVLLLTLTLIFELQNNITCRML